MTGLPISHNSVPFRRRTAWDGWIGVYACVIPPSQYRCECTFVSSYHICACVPPYYIIVSLSELFPHILAINSCPLSRQSFLLPPHFFKFPIFLDFVLTLRSSCIFLFPLKRLTTRRTTTYIDFLCMREQAANCSLFSAKIT